MFTKLSGSGSPVPGSGSASGYNSYFGQLQNAANDNVMCRPVHWQHDFQENNCKKKSKSKFHPAAKNRYKISLCICFYML